MSAHRGILVVDDDPDIRRTLGLVLERNGYTVKAARNGKDALTVLEGWRPDLVILDIMMTTDTEGYDVALKIKEDERYKNLPIIILTSFLEKVRLEGPGIFGEILGEEWPTKWLFEKPVNWTKLLAKIQGALADR